MILQDETHRLAEELTGPVVEGERRAVLDALRGLAITGVLVANVFTFAYPMVSSSPQISALRGTDAADRVVQISVGIFVEGKFDAMLSVLFGMGLMLQSRRVAERGGRFDQTPSVSHPIRIRRAPEQQGLWYRANLKRLCFRAAVGR